jgi:hypothetical protein
MHTVTKLAIAAGAAIVLARGPQSCSHVEPASPAPATQSDKGDCLTAIVDPDGRGQQVADAVNKQNGCSQ